MKLHSECRIKQPTNNNQPASSKLIPKFGILVSLTSGYVNCLLSAIWFHLLVCLIQFELNFFNSDFIKSNSNNKWIKLSGKAKQASHSHAAIQLNWFPVADWFKLIHCAKTFSIWNQSRNQFNEAAWNGFANSYSPIKYWNHAIQHCLNILIVSNYCYNNQFVCRFNFWLIDQSNFSFLKLQFVESIQKWNNRQQTSFDFSFS